MRCHICGNTNKSNFEKSFLPKTLYCSVCGIHFTRDIKSPEYKENYYRNSDSESVVSKLSKPALNLLEEIKINRILTLVKFIEKPRILDYGCGAGNLVKRLILLNIDTLGFEPSRGARKITTKENLPVQGDLKMIKGKFDLIMFWLSLEHVPDPVDVINNAKKLLIKGGRLLIAVPNAESWEAMIAKEKWFHYTYPLHRFYFSFPSLSYLLKKCSLKIESVDCLNFEYTSTGLAQTLLNLILPKDVLYSIVGKRRRSMKKGKAILFASLSIIILIMFSPLVVIFFIIQLFFRKTGAMVVIAK